MFTLGKCSLHPIQSDTTVYRGSLSPYTTVLMPLLLPLHLPLLLCSPFRYYLKGPKAGTHDVFISNLPGNADNIGHSRNGNIWVALATTRTDPVSDFMSRNGWTRLLLAKVTGYCHGNSDGDGGMWGLQQ